MTKPIRATFSQLFRSMRARIVLLMTLAILPLGLISVSHTNDLIADTEQLRQEAIFAETARFTVETRNVMREAFGAAKGLAAALAIVAEADGPCDELMSRFVTAAPGATFAGFVRSDGIMTCSSDGDSIDFSKSRSFARQLEDPAPQMIFSRMGPATGEAVVMVWQPVFENDLLAGFVSISIPLLIIRDTFHPEAELEDYTVAVISEHGVVLSGEALTYAEARMPGNIPLAMMLTGPDRVFSGESRDGEHRNYSISNVIPGEIAIVGSSSAGSANRLDEVWDRFQSLAFPILMWLASIGVVAFGVHRLAVRHVRQLQSAMRKFALGDRSQVGLELKDAPEELQDAARSFNRMSFILSEAEDRAQKDLKDKELLLLEVHHRVKNNLQFIASIINIQMRRVESEEAREILVGLQKRVRGFAVMYSTMYANTEMTNLDAAELIREMVADMSRIASQEPSGAEIETDLTPVRIVPDQAASLTMLFVEALTNAIKHGANSTLGGPIRVSLAELADGRVQLEIRNPLSPVIETEEDPYTGLGSRLMRAFADQMEAEVEQGEEDGMYRYSIVFPKDLGAAGASETHAA